MGLWSRFSLIFKAKASKALDAAESSNMNETLDYSYQRQLDMLAKVKRGLTDIATSRKQVENQINEIDNKSDTLSKQAEKAIEMGREDLAREALTKKSYLQQQRNDLVIQHEQLQIEEEKISRTSQALQTKVEQFRVRKETVKAKFAAASATTNIQEAYAGIDGEWADVGLAISAAEDKTAQMQARSDAIGELLASGALDDNTTDSIQRELDSMDSDHSVENELEAMKATLALPAPNNS